MKTFKNLFAAAAVLIFSDHKNIDSIFITSDGQGFTDEEKAKDQARYLKDKEIKHFERGFEDTFEDDQPEGEKMQTGKEPDEDEAERVKLFARYEELFEKKATHNMKTETLKAKILEKEAEQDAAK